MVAEILEKILTAKSSPLEFSGESFFETEGNRLKVVLYLSIVVSIDYVGER